MFKNDIESLLMYFKYFFNIFEIILRTFCVFVRWGARAKGS